MKPARHILPVIVICQFLCTSLWFAGNAVLNDLITDFNLAENVLGHLTSAVQFGFITGTLVFAILTIADRFSPSKVFFVSALLGALFNLAIIWDGNQIQSILILRFFTGFFLAGIYPVGMKIAADYFDQGLGKSLGYLVGALVIGTALPHLLNDMTSQFPWHSVIFATSSLAAVGGVLMLCMVADGPFRKPSQRPDFSAFFSVFRKQEFRSAAFGYFGHMWELYAFWAFIPVILKTYTISHPQSSLNISLLSFLIIGIGGIACFVGGYLSQKINPKRIATLALLLSCLCCLMSPLILTTEWQSLFLGFLFFWGSFVIMDSPLFSTLVAHNASSQKKGTALTIVNCVGFAITIVSIQLMNWVQSVTQSNLVFMILAIGPILGLIALMKGDGQVE